jgi:hypothetical protein
VDGMSWIPAEGKYCPRVAWRASVVSGSDSNSIPARLRFIVAGKPSTCFVVPSAATSRTQNRVGEGSVQLFVGPPSHVSVLSVPPNCHFGCVSMQSRC